VRHVPVGSVGVCVPSADFALPTTLLAAIVTARVAGVPRVVACTPLIAGQLPCAFVAALQLAGADEIYALAGVHGVAALAFGTESIPRVEVVIGPSDAPTAEAKRQLFGDRSVTLSATPRELLVIADESADPELVATDLLAAIASGPDARAVLISTSIVLAASVPAALARALDALPGGELAGRTWQRGGAIHVVRDRQAACALADRHGFELVEIMTVDPRWFLRRLRSCGQVLVGAATATALADAGAGALLPPAAPTIRRRDSLWIGSFLKTVTYREGADGIGLAADALARQHRLDGHEALARTIELRTARAAAPTPSATSGPSSLAALSAAG
jgi:sulfopropanediol 3-dehydrogenase